MTIHRDLLRMEREARVSRMHGGATIVGGRGLSLCESCGQAVVPHQHVGGYCCAHCALKNCPDPSLLLFRDFISGDILAADKAYFLLNTMVDICCRPTILAFAKEDEVVNFRLGFGGVIGRLSEALEFLHLEGELTDQPISSD